MQRSIVRLPYFREKYLTTIKIFSQTMSGAAGIDNNMVVKHDAKKFAFFIQLDPKGKKIKLTKFKN